MEDNHFIFSFLLKLGSTQPTDFRNNSILTHTRPPNCDIILEENRFVLDCAPKKNKKKQ